MTNTLDIPNIHVQDTLSVLLKIFQNTDRHITIEGQEIVVLLPGMVRDMTLRMLNVIPTEGVKQVVTISTIRKDGRLESQAAIDDLIEICDTVNQSSKFLTLEIGELI